MSSHSQSPRSQRGQVLIGVLIAIALLALVGSALYMQLKKGGAYSNAIGSANNVSCISYTGQIRQAMMMYKQDNDGKNPPDLNALKKYGVTSEMINSPGCEYGYDASTGRIKEPSRLSPIGQEMRRHAAPTAQNQSNQPNQQYQPQPNQQQAQPPSNPNTTVVSGPNGVPIKVPTGGGSAGADVNGGE
jgi:FtsZ-interacting cell division protein ZipA